MSPAYARGLVTPLVTIRAPNRMFNAGICSSESYCGSADGSSTEFHRSPSRVLGAFDMSYWPGSATIAANRGSREAPRGASRPPKERPTRTETMGIDAGLREHQVDHAGNDVFPVGPHGP